MTLVGDECSAVAMRDIYHLPGTSPPDERTSISFLYREPRPPWRYLASLSSGRGYVSGFHEENLTASRNVASRGVSRMAIERSNI